MAKAKASITPSDAASDPDGPTGKLSSDFDSDQPKTGLKAATCREKTPK